MTVSGIYWPAYNMTGSVAGPISGVMLDAQMCLSFVCKTVFCWRRLARRYARAARQRKDRNCMQWSVYTSSL